MKEANLSFFHQNICAFRKEGFARLKGMESIMKSFTRNLVITFTGVILISFLAVYFFFNALVDNYIRAQAEREFSAGVVTATDRIDQTNELTRGVRIRTGEITNWTIPSDIWISATADEIHTGFDENFVLQVQQFQAFQPVRRSIITADTIVINHLDEIMMPWTSVLTDMQLNEIELLANHYTSNRNDFLGEEMVMFTLGNSTYYLRAVTHSFDENSVSILMYTDISSAIAFKDSMNQRLIILLLLSGISGIAISIILSNRFQRAIVRLCRYADTIGHGKFNQDPGNFKYSEFDTLSKSMSNMANMLQSYENNQKQFFQNASHELRTPLMSIQGYAEGILADIFDKEEATQIILTEGQKMTDLVSSLLYISRLDSGLETSNVLSHINVKNLLYDCHERVKIIAENSGKQISVSLPKSGECLATTIISDATKLEMAIINILSNAIRHAKSHVELSFYVREKAVIITIQDDGTGISPKDLPHIFERFYKGENGNSGLGLAISKDIITSLNGTITVVNLPPPKHGAMFEIML